MNLNRYEIFLKVSEIGNITKAADILHYSQAGISHAIAALEKETGVSLFLRSSNGVTLTESGKKLLNPIQALVNEQNNLSQTIYELNNVIAGTLRVGTFTSVSVHWLPEIIRLFQEKYPQAKFELIAGDYDEIKEGIRSGKLDCGFLTESVEKNLAFFPLYDDPMMALLASSHPLAEKESISLAELVKEPFILPTKGSDDDILSVLGKYRPSVRVAYTLNDDFSVIAMVAKGYGVTIMPELIYKYLNIDIVPKPLVPMTYRTIGIAALPMNQINPLTKAFIRFLTQDGAIFYESVSARG